MREKPTLKAFDLQLWKVWESSAVMLVPGSASLSSLDLTAVK